MTAYISYPTPLLPGLPLPSLFPPSSPEATDSADGATAKPSAAKVTDWASVKWNELGQTSDSR